jgi:PAS domain S-box-containing protein
MVLSKEISDEYVFALKNYIIDNSETTLNHAYELGRRSLENGQQILDIARVHLGIIADIVNESAAHSANEEMISNSMVFFTEYLSPFVMTFKGFWEVVENLKREINVRVRAEEAYRQSVNYYESLLRNALDIITILDEKGNMIYYSTASVERILGYEKDELIGKNAFVYIHPDDIDRVLELFNKTIYIPGYTTITEFRFRHKNGEWVILESVGKNLLNDPDIAGVIVNSRDITDRRNIEDIRRKYEFIANASKEMMGLINRDYKYEAVNEEYCTAFSKERSDLIGRSIAEIFGVGIFDKFIKEQIDRCFEGLEIIHEIWLPHPVLGKKYLELAYYPYRNQRNNVTHVVFVNRDITERKKKEDEIKKSQMQLAEAQRIARIGSWEWSLTTNSVRCSEELCSIFGLDPLHPEITFDEFLGFVPVDERERVRKVLLNALTTLKPFILEHEILRHGKGKQILQTRGKVLFDENKLTSKIIGTSQDITKQELAQQAIKSSEIKYRRLFETSKEGVILLDSSTGIISDINPFVIDLLGYPIDSYIGKKLWEIKAVRGNPETEKAFRNIIEKGYARYGELELNTKDRKKVKVEFISIAYTVNSYRLIQCHLWDITERKQLQEELNRTARQRSEDLKKFAHSVQQAHEEERLRISRELHDDVCQRLTAIKFQLNIFEDALKEKKKISGIKLRSAKKEIDELIKEVRGISSNLRPTALDHFGLVTALKLLSAESRKIRSVKINFSSNIPTFRHFNPNIEIALYRIGQEALANCIKHSGAKEIKLKISEKDNQIQFRIEDNGSGFDFEKYRERSKTDNGHFGLINMRERTEQFGGTFKINSALGKGTSVQIIIPVKEKDTNEKN